DVVSWGGGANNGLQVVTIDGPMDISQFSCTFNELRELRGYQFSSDELLPPDRQAVAEEILYPVRDGKVDLDDSMATLPDDCDIGNTLKALNQKYLDLTRSATEGLKVQYHFVRSGSNAADVGTRHDVLQRVLDLRESLRLEKIEKAKMEKKGAAPDSALVVRIRDRFGYVRDRRNDDEDACVVGRKRRRVSDAAAGDNIVTGNARNGSHGIFNNARPVRLDELDYAGTVLSGPLLQEYLQQRIGAIDGVVEPMRIEDKDMQLALIRAARNAAHDGIDATLSRLQRSFVWSNMKAMVKSECDGCTLCSVTKVAPGDKFFKQPPTVARVLPVPFHKVQMDVLGPVGGSARMYVTTLCCCYTGYVATRATLRCPTYSDVLLLLNWVYRIFGHVPEIVQSDNASIFVKASQGVPFTWQFSPVRGSVSNGMIERKHRCINTKLRRLNFQGVKPTTDREWQDMLDKIVGELNASPIPKAGGLSALDVLLRYPPTDLLTGLPRLLPKDSVKIWDAYRTKCAERSANAIGVKDRRIEPGQVVYLRCDDHAPKLAPRYTPVTVEAILGSNRIRLTDGTIVHSKDLKVLQNHVREDSDDDDGSDDDSEDNTSSTTSANGDDSRIDNVAD
ncbi:hypothetical protein FOZ62_027860, partial [Perkinsus olseni]